MENNPTKKTISLVLPCLNEEKSISWCIQSAKIGLTKSKKLGFSGEIIVVDNGSEDRSVTLARRTGAKVVFEKKRGYGAAYKKGIRSAQGQYIIIGDSDGTYDFQKIEYFIEELIKGAHLVLGSRFKGKIKEKSMPFLHRYLGNPLITATINLFYGCHLSDSQTGFRAFTRKAYKTMRLKSNGMEFASEMIFKAVLSRLKITEIPINYYPRSGHSKLSPIKDAWRHITSILIYSPTYVFIIPGFVIFLLGATGTILLLPGPLYFGKIMIDIHTMIISIFLAAIGIHIILTGFITRLYTVKRLGIKGGPLTKWLLKYVSLDMLFISGVALTAISLVVIGLNTLSWIASGFVLLSQDREFIAATGIGMIGGQLAFSSFLFELLNKDV